MSSAPLKKFIQQNSYQLITAVITALLVAFSAYVSFQLWQQKMTLRVEAQEQALAELRKVQEQPSALIQVMQADIKYLVESHKESRTDIKDIKEYLLNNK